MEYKQNDRKDFSPIPIVKIIQFGWTIVLTFRILLLEPIHDDGIRLLREFADARLAQIAKEPDVLREFEDVDCIITRLTRVTATMIDAAPHLQVIARHGVGYDNIDVEYATKRGNPSCLRS